MDLAKQLNDKQLEAVLYTDGPLLILAGAGSGKTRVLTYKIAHLIGKHNYSPDSILGVTFTNKAAQEMKDRVASLLGGRRPMWISTFHSACVRILRRDIEKLGWGKNFVIYDEYDKSVKIREIIKDLNINDKRITPGSVIGCISRAKNSRVSPDKYRADASDYFTQIIADIYGNYDKQMLKNNALDFDDLLLKAVQLFEEDPRALEVYQNKFKYILVDEYQDVNYIQYLLIKYLSERQATLCVVGDDDQSIYGFRGADVSLILQFEKDFPKSKIVKLEQNYRSTKTILEAANSLVRYNAGRKSKKLWTDNHDGELIAAYSAVDERDEARFVVNKIKELTYDGTRGLKDIVILYRTNAQSRAFEEYLLSGAVPYKIIGGLKFYERKEIKDIIAYLRAITNPNDSVSLKRVINVPPRGIGLTSFSKIYAYAERNDISLYEALRQISDIDVQDKVKSKIKDFIKILAELSIEAGKLPVTGLVKLILQKSGMKQALIDENTADSLTRLENLEEFLSVTQEFEKRIEGPDLENFLAEVSLLSDIDNYSQEQDSVTLMTLHCSKGLEFPVVFIAGLEEGIFPHARSLYSQEELEEERRLCYVGITRAKEKLYLLSARARTIFGTTMQRDRSRFLDEIQEEFIVDETPVFEKAARRDIYVDKNRYDIERERLTFNFKKDMQVLHHLWGKGIVRDVEDDEITVEFAKIGTKIVLAEFLKPESVSV